jgi:excisionase family DNA binding protein
MDNFYTVKEVAQILKVNVHTVYRWIKSGKLQAINFGDAVRISETELNKFIDKHKA